MKDRSSLTSSPVCIGIGQGAGARSPAPGGAGAPALRLLHPPLCLWDLGCSPFSQRTEKESVERGGWQVVMGCPGDGYVPLDSYSVDQNPDTGRYSTAGGAVACNPCGPGGGGEDELAHTGKPACGSSLHLGRVFIPRRLAS